MKQILKLINDIKINNQKMKLSVLASSLVFYLILAVIPFFELLEYILNKCGAIEETISNVEVFNGKWTTIYFIIYFCYVSSKLLHMLHQVSDLMYYNVKERPHLKLRIISFFYLIIILLITVVMIVLLTYFSYIINRFSIPVTFFINFLQFIFPLTWIIFLFIFLYKKIVPVPIRWQETIGIACITGFIIYTILRLYQIIVMGYLLNKYKTVYGNFASLISLLVWLYLSCYIFLSGMVFLFMKKVKNKV